MAKNEHGSEHGGARGGGERSRLEFQVVAQVPVLDMTTRLSDLSADGWTIEAFTASAPGEYTALLSRPAPRRHRGAAGPDDND